MRIKYLFEVDPWEVFAKLTIAGGTLFVLWGLVVKSHAHYNYVVTEEIVSARVISTGKKCQYAVGEAEVSVGASYAVESRDCPFSQGTVVDLKKLIWHRRAGRSIEPPVKIFYVLESRPQTSPTSESDSRMPIILPGFVF